jgi:hypothetical protein
MQKVGHMGYIYVLVNAYTSLLSWFFRPYISVFVLHRLQFLRHIRSVQIYTDCPNNQFWEIIQDKFISLQMFPITSNTA